MKPFTFTLDFYSDYKGKQNQHYKIICNSESEGLDSLIHHLVKGHKIRAAWITVRSRTQLFKSVQFRFNLTLVKNALPEMMEKDLSFYTYMQYQYSEGKKIITGYLCQ